MQSKVAPIGLVLVSDGPAEWLLKPLGLTFDERPRDANSDGLNGAGGSDLGSKAGYSSRTRTGLVSTVSPAEMARWASTGTHGSFSFGPIG